MTARDAILMPAGDAASLLRGLGEIAAAIGAASKDADGKLLAVGERLAGAVGILGGLTHRFEALPQELEGDALRGAADRLGAVSQELAAMARGLAGERSALARLAGLNQQMGMRLTQLRKTIHAIAMLAVNAQIEAAHIGDKGEDFTAFANQIVRLARTAGAMTEGYAREHEKLARLLKTAGDTQAGFVHAREETLRSVGQQLEASLQAVESRRLQAAAAAVEIGQRSKRITEEIGVAVAGLQIGDITRQRLEHVGEALTMLSAGLEPRAAGADQAGSWSRSLADHRKPAAAAAICRMQSVQTAEALAEFDSEVRRVVASLARLAEEAAAIVRFGGETYGAAGRRERSFIEDLQEKMRAASGLVRECKAARGAVDAVISSVQRSLDELLTHLGSVRVIEVDMRLVGLNTTLKCSRLGADGRTLSVVAQELRGYANQTVQDADALMAALEDITAAARQFEQEGEGRDTARMAAMEQEMTAALAPFEECGARLGGALTALVEEGGQVSRLLQDTAAGIAVHDAIGQSLNAACRRLDNLAGEGAAEQIDAADLRECIQFFADGRYTMASERKIHARFAPGGREAAGAPSAPAEAALDDILF